MLRDLNVTWQKSSKGQDDIRKHNQTNSLSDFGRHCYDMRERRQAVPRERWRRIHDVCGCAWFRLHPNIVHAQSIHDLVAVTNMATPNGKVLIQ